jgi:hypothetical protein
VIVKQAFTHRYGHGGTVEVPAGARTEKPIGPANFRWVDPSIFPKGSIDRHDAEHYGIPVPFDNIEENTNAK